LLAVSVGAVSVWLLLRELSPSSASGDSEEEIGGGPVGLPGLPSILTAPAPPPPYIASTPSPEFSSVMSRRLTAKEIAILAGEAGFSGEDLITAVAVALAESHGDPNAYNPEVLAGTPPGKGSYGLWQIYLKAHPEFEGVNLWVPRNNAAAAFSVYRAARFSFRPWSTFKNRAYIAHLSIASGSVNA
jgi:hypothetical protein